MKKKDLFAKFGDMVDRLTELDHTAFFEYSGHVDNCCFRVFLNGWQSGKNGDFFLHGSDFSSQEAHLTKCLELTDFLVTISLNQK